jgi:hypothetical protein
MPDQSQLSAPAPDAPTKGDFCAAEDVTRQLSLSLTGLQDSVEFTWKNPRKAKYALPSLAGFYWEGSTPTAAPRESDS